MQKFLILDPEAANKYMQLFLHGNGNEENIENNALQSGNESESNSSGGMLIQYT
jgi:hypothetical protein